MIEATARSPIMGFRDDVVIRISPMGQGTRIDVRSASRVGTHDLGANASRIRSLLEDIDDVVSSAPEPRQPPPTKTPSFAEGPPARQASAGQAIDAVNRRLAVGCDDAARDQILQMREYR